MLGMKKETNRVEMVQVSRFAQNIFFEQFLKPVLVVPESTISISDWLIRDSKRGVWMIIRPHLLPGSKFFFCFSFWVRMARDQSGKRNFAISTPSNHSFKIVWGKKE